MLSTSEINGQIAREKNSLIHKVIELTVADSKVRERGIGSWLIRESRKPGCLSITQNHGINTGHIRLALLNGTWVNCSEEEKLLEIEDRIEAVYLRDSNKEEEMASFFGCLEALGFDVLDNQLFIQPNIAEVTHNDAYSGYTIAKEIDEMAAPISEEQQRALEGVRQQQAEIIGGVDPITLEELSELPQHSITDTGARTAFDPDALAAWQQVNSTDPLTREIVHQVITTGIFARTQRRLDNISRNDASATAEGPS